MIAAHPFTRKVSPTQGMRKRSAIRGRRDDTLAFQNMHDGCGIQPAGTTQKNRTLQQTNISLRVETVAARRPMRGNEAHRFPGAQGRRGNAHTARHFADAQQPAQCSIC